MIVEMYWYHSVSISFWTVVTTHLNLSVIHIYKQTTEDPHVFTDHF